MDGRRLQQAPPALAPSLDRLWKSSASAPGIAMIRVCARFGRPEAIQTALRLAGDRHQPSDQRIAMIALLGQLGRRVDIAALSALCDPVESESIQLAALAALGQFQDASLAPALLARARAAAPVVRDRIVSTLASRPDWARALVEAMARGEIAPRELTPASVALIARLADPALSHRLESLWGKMPAPARRQRNNASPRFAAYFPRVTRAAQRAASRSSRSTARFATSSSTTARRSARSSPVPTAAISTSC